MAEKKMAEKKCGSISVSNSYNTLLTLMVSTSLLSLTDETYANTALTSVCNETISGLTPYTTTAMHNSHRKLAVGSYRGSITIDE